MRFSLSAAAALAFSTLASCAPLGEAPIEERAARLQPWQLTALIAFSPSGRPGSYPWLTITANLTDPNELILGTAPDDNSTVSVPAGNTAPNCRAKWLSGENPHGRSWPCDPTGDGYWTMKIPKTEGFSANNFTAVFTRVAEVLYHGSSYRKEYTASKKFFLGSDGNLSGVCGGSGVCSWGLKEGLAPYPIQQREVTN
ncbi:hypothetical protein BU26DRAFT_513851 [Trematosphaeria pertusa]|uniref:Cell death in tomato 1 n=1 Tax=Trematosphaeria pertusa TaxID=390896 RepID=A0A6A6J3Z7_9PLEO|nr:uncharacterized protein BU26DRAFT_513851 [Trematosphaeria pertusa]KAF2257141.1 hypothetical protein BU26DRAFT_513851 [Trematosphaeria pertusa]